MEDFSVGTKPVEVNLTWNDINEAITELARKVEVFNYSLDGVIAIARGGLVPATLIAGKLGIRRIKSIQIQKYVDQKIVSEPKLLDNLSDIEDGIWLIVDDITGSGDTFAKVCEELSKVRTKQKIFIYSSIYIAKGFLPTLPEINVTRTPFLYGYRLNENFWLNFPWEKGRPEGNR